MYVHKSDKLNFLSMDLVLEQVAIFIVLYYQGESIREMIALIENMKIKRE